MYSIFINRLNLAAIGFMITQRPDMPAPQRRFKEIEIPGRDGTLTIDEGTYDDIDLKVELNYVSHPDRWHERFRQIKMILRDAKGAQLRFSDDQGYFMKIKKCSLGTNERVLRVGGKMKATFTLDPFFYAESGLSEIHSWQTIMNNFDLSQPVYRITGEGMCTLTVNGKTMKANVGQNLIIDTSLRLAYRTDGTIQNTSVSGSYEDLYLLPGLNNLSLSDGFSMAVQPNWRCI